MRDYPHLYGYDAYNALALLVDIVATSIKYDGEEEESKLLKRLLKVTRRKNEHADYFRDPMGICIFSTGETSIDACMHPSTLDLLATAINWCLKTMSIQGDPENATETLQKLLRAVTTGGEDWNIPLEPFKQTMLAMMMKDIKAARAGASSHIYENDERFKDKLVRFWEAFGRKKCT